MPGFKVAMQSAGRFAACGRETMVRQACLWKTSQNNIHSSSQEAKQAGRHPCQYQSVLRQVCPSPFRQANARHVKLLFFCLKKGSHHVVTYSVPQQQGSWLQLLGAVGRIDIWLWLSVVLHLHLKRQT